TRGARPRRRPRDSGPARAGGLFARARRPARLGRGRLDGDRVFALHVHGSRLEGPDGDDPVRDLRRLPLPAARAPRRPRRGAGAGAVDGRPDHRRGVRMGRDGGRDPGSHLKRTVVLVVALAVAVALGLGLYADFGKLGDELRKFEWELFPLATALTAVNYLI